MIDGIKITCPIPDYTNWSEKVNLKFIQKVSLDGELQIVSRPKDTMNGIYSFATTYTATFQSYSLTLIKTEIGTCLTDISNTTYRLNIKGSLHKNYFKSPDFPNGANYQDFTYDFIEVEINNLINKLCLDSSLCKIQNIEFGLNIPMDQSVMPFLESNLLLYKSKLFEKWLSKKSKSIGYQCDFSQYTVKIYDKSLQYDLEYPSMRFEVKIKKMQMLKKSGISYLSDLMDIIKLKSLLEPLMKAWDNILFIDPELYLNKLSKEEALFLNNCSNMKFWKNLKKTGIIELNANRNKLIRLHKKYHSRYSQMIRAIMNKKWGYLFEPQLIEIQ